MRILKIIVVIVFLSVIGLAGVAGYSYANRVLYPDHNIYCCCYDSDHEIPARVVDFHGIYFHTVGRCAWVLHGPDETEEDMNDFCEVHRERLENVTIVDVTGDTCAIVIGDRTNVYTYAVDVPLSQLSYDSEQFESVSWRTNYCHIANYNGYGEFEHYLNGNPWFRPNGLDCAL